MHELSGDMLCCACHGLSLLITATRGNQLHTVLFDSGPEEYAFERNAARLKLDLGAVESVVLSHGHWDHGAVVETAWLEEHLDDANLRIVNAARYAPSSRSLTPMTNSPPPK